MDLPSFHGETQVKYDISRAVCPLHLTSKSLIYMIEQPCQCRRTNRESGHGRGTQASSLHTRRSTHKRMRAAAGLLALFLLVAVMAPASSQALRQNGDEEAVQAAFEASQAAAATATPTSRPVSTPPPRRKCTVVLCRRTCRTERPTYCVTCA